MKVRLRDPLPNAGYQVVRDNFAWPDHVLRLLVTAGAVAWLQPNTVCDPACGDASILETAYRLRPFSHALLGDISEPQINALRPRFPSVAKAGDAISIVEQLTETFDVMVLTEVLEHLEEPEQLIEAARHKAKYLVASSPIDEMVSVGNHEHVWSWGKEDYKEMLVAAGWDPFAFTEISFANYLYSYQLWVCR